MQKKYNKFTNRLENVLEKSKTLALGANKKEVETQDFFLALIEAKGSIAREILYKSGLKLPAIKKKVYGNRSGNRIFSYSQAGN
ncbi:hypothetical protein L6278_00160 [Candidatus Parcubacteria bacterium]|nr:hypothetical protein [Candidatus Parcubacteria bacterium]